MTDERVVGARGATFFFEWSFPWDWHFRRDHHGHVRRWMFGWWSWGVIQMPFGPWIDALVEITIRKTRDNSLPAKAIEEIQND